VLAGLVTAATVTAAIGAAPSGARQLRCDAGRRRPIDEFNTVRIGCLRWPWRFDRDDRDAVDAELSLSPHDVAGFSRLIEERGIDGPSRVEGPRSPPRPGTVGPRAGQLDLYTAGHRTNVQLRSRSANHKA
jgi:hypothetical protein